MQSAWDDKAPEEKCLRGFNWAIRLGDDSIVESEWEVLSGTVTLIDVPLNDPYITGVKLDGGTDGETCLVQNKVKTTHNQELIWVGRVSIRAT